MVEHRDNVSTPAFKPYPSLGVASAAVASECCNYERARKGSALALGVDMSADHRLGHYADVVTHSGTGRHVEDNVLAFTRSVDAVPDQAISAPGSSVIALH